MTREARKKAITYWAGGRLAMKVLLNGCDSNPQGLGLGRTATGKNRYPLKSMHVGQFFFVPNNGRTTIKTQNTVTSSVNHARKTTGKQFHQRRLRTGVQVWRIE